MISTSEAVAFKTLLAESKFVVVITHDFPDGDAVGSVYAFCSYLKAINKEYKICFNNLDEELWDKLFNNYDNKRINSADLRLYKESLLVVVDCSNLDRLGPLKDNIREYKKIINIDHHGDNSLFGDLNIVKEATATGEVLFNLFKSLEFRLDTESGKAMLTAIIADSGRFQFVNTQSHSFRIVSEIVNVLGMDIYFQIVQSLYEEVSLDKLKLLADAISNVEFFSNGVAFSYITEDAGFSEGLIDQIRAIRGVKVAVLVRKINDLLKISFRSKDKNISVRELAGKFGGGGHPGASGATLPLVNFQKQILEIKKEVQKYAESL